MPACRQNVLLVIDAAYAEYVTANDYESGIELVARRDNVVMTRTFSKLYGLAGLRHRLGAMRRPRSSMRSTASAGRSTSTSPATRRASRRSATATISSAPSRTTSNGCPG